MATLGHLSLSDLFARAPAPRRVPRVRGSSDDPELGRSWGAVYGAPGEPVDIDTLQECDVAGATRLTGTSWDEARVVGGEGGGPRLGPQGAPDSALPVRG